MRAAGADLVRLQTAQVAADPQSPLFGRPFLEKANGAIRAAGAAGLTVIVSVQDETYVPGIIPLICQMRVPGEYGRKSRHSLHKTGECSSSC